MVVPLVISYEERFEDDAYVFKRDDGNRLPVPRHVAERIQEETMARTIMDIGQCANERYEIKLRMKFSSAWLEQYEAAYAEARACR